MTGAPLIAYESPSFIIADKPHGMPTVPLKGRSPEGTLLGAVARLYPEVLSIRGRNAWEGGALHRLDTATSGLVIFARTQAFYDHLSRIQADGLFAKSYSAVTIPSDRLKGTDADVALRATGKAGITSYFRSYGPGARQVRPTLDIKRADTPVLYTTSVALSVPGDLSAPSITSITSGLSVPGGPGIPTTTLICTITRGFRHQIRAHLAWAGHPIVGDDLYGTPDGGILMLDCFSVSFPDEDGKPFVFTR